MGSIAPSMLSALALTGCLLQTGGDLRRGWDGNSSQDTDGDGVPDDQPDNCPDIPNRSQSDFDADGVGNACDPDASGQDVDGDGIEDSLDMCNGERSGTNEDGDVYPSVPWQIVDDCDNCPSVPNPDQANADGDDVGDACEAPGDEAALANIVFFDRLRDDLSGWRIMDYSGWEFGLGELRADPSTVLHAIVPDEISEKAGTIFAIETEVAMQESSEGGPFWSGVLLSSVLNPGRTDLDQWHACVIMVDPAESMEIHVSLRAMEVGCTTDECRLGEVLRSEATGVTFVPGTPLRLHALRDGNRISCMLGPHSGDIMGSVTMSVASLYTGGPGLTAAGAACAFQNATLYGPP